MAQRWADFFASLVHGPELASLDAYLLSATEVRSVCGRGALACYGGNEIYAPAEDPIVTELGHLDLAHLTPIEALNLLAKWQARTRERG